MEDDLSGEIINANEAFRLALVTTWCRQTSSKPRQWKLPIVSRKRARSLCAWPKSGEDASRSNLDEACARSRSVSLCFSTKTKMRREGFSGSAKLNSRGSNLKSDAIDLGNEKWPSSATRAGSTSLTHEEARRMCIDWRLKDVTDFVLSATKPRRMTALNPTSNSKTTQSVATAVLRSTVR